ncbi:hypothetical protein JCM5296_006030 [Sporobolomyces johnsonii]
MSELSLNIKGPSDTKLSVTVGADATVADLKQEIERLNGDFPKDQQRLIFSGRVLKDDDPLAKYGVKNGVAIHLVKGARPAGASSSTPAARGPSEAAGVPSHFGAGQQVMNNPLAPLMNAQYAGQLGGFNPFASMGINPNDPNYLQNLMNSPEVQAQMNQLLSDPAVVDQVIASNPQLQAMGPQVRQLMQSEHFRSFLTNPAAMQNMMQMMGGGGAGGGGAFPPPGAFGAAGGGAHANPSATGGNAPNLFNPWASTPAAPSAGETGSAAEGAQAGAGAGAGAAGGFNPFGGAAGGGQQPDMGQMLAQLQQMQQLFGGMGGGMGGFGGGGPVGGGPQVSPEERYATQLEQMQGMGFTDAARNVRALLAAGGSVEGAVAWLFDNPQ